MNQKAFWGFGEEELIHSGSWFSSFCSVQTCYKSGHVAQSQVCAGSQEGEAKAWPCGFASQPSILVLFPSCGEADVPAW